MKDFKQQYYDVISGRRWRATRAAYGASVKWLCEDCMRQGIATPGTQVHHIEPITPRTIGDPSKVYGWENLVLLCKACHDKRHGKLGVYVDEWGHVDLE